MPTNDSLIKGVAAGNRGDFAKLYRALQNEMLRYATGILAGDRAAAEDAVDEAFTAVWHQASRYTGEGSADGWVRRIVRNKAIDIARRNRESTCGEYEERLLINTPSDANSPYDNVANMSERAWLSRAMERLSVQHREVLWLFYFEEQPVSRIAIIVDCPENTVKTRLFHARQLMKSQLERQECLVEKSSGVM